jgi:NAD(P)H dehydrogenase (quinone)
MEIFGDPLERIWKDCIFDLCGVRNFYRRMFNIVCISTEEERKNWLNEVTETIAKIFPTDTIC